MRSLIRYEDLLDGEDEPQGVQGQQKLPVYEDLFPEDQDRASLPAYEDLFPEDQKPLGPTIEAGGPPEPVLEAIEAPRGSQATLQTYPDLPVESPRFAPPSGEGTTPWQALRSGAEGLVETAGRVTQTVGKKLREARERAPTEWLRTAGPEIGAFLEEKGQAITEAAQKRREGIPRPAKGMLDEDATVEERLEAAAYGITEGLVSSLPSLAGGTAGLAVAGPAGAFAGATLPSYLQNQDELDQQLQAAGVDETRAGRIASLGAIPMAALDAAPIAGLLSKVGRRKAEEWALKTVFKDLAAQGVFEGTTEAAQNAIAQTITQRVTGKPISWSQLAESGIVGMGVGTVMGGGVSTVGAIRAKPVVSPAPLTPSEPALPAYEDLIIPVETEVETALAKPPLERIAELEAQYPELQGKGRAELEAVRQGPSRPPQTALAAPQTIEQAPGAPRVPLLLEKSSERLLEAPTGVPEVGTIVPEAGRGVEPPTPPERLGPPGPPEPPTIGPRSPLPPEPLGEVPESGLTLEERRRESSDALRTAVRSTKRLLPEYAQRLREALQGIQIPELQTKTERTLAKTKEFFAGKEEVMPLSVKRDLARLESKPAADYMPEEIDALTEKVQVLTQLSRLKRKLGARQEFREAEWEAEAIDLAREHAKATKTLRQVAKRVETLDLRPEYKKVINGALEDIDLGQMSPRIKRLAEKTAAFFDERAPGTVIPESAQKRIDRLRKRPVGDMSPDEISGLVEDVQTAVHLNQTKNKLIAAQHGRTIDAEAKVIVAEAKQRLPELTSKEGEVPKRGVLSLFAREGGARPETNMERVSPRIVEDVWDKVGVESYDVELTRKHQLENAVVTAAKDVGLAFHTKEFEQWRSEKFSLQVPPAAKAPQGVKAGLQAVGKLGEPPAKPGARTLKITRDEAIEVLAQLLAPANRKKAYRDGFTVERLGPKNSFTMTDDVVRQVEQIAGDQGKTLAQAAFDQYNRSMKQWLNDAYVQTYGSAVAEIPDYMPQALDMTKISGADPLSRFRSALDATLESWRHLKPREGSSAPIQIRGFLDSYFNHARHVARISANLASVRDAFALLEHPEVRQTVIDRVGQEGYDRITDAISMQVVPPVTVGRGERIFRRALRRVASAVLGVRLSPILSTPANLSVAAAYQTKGFSNLNRAAAVLNPKEYQRIVADAEKYAPYWSERYNSENFARELTGNLIGERKSSYGGPDITERFLFGLTAGDKLFAAWRYKMAELELAQTQPGLQGEAFKVAAAREWTKLMYRSDNTAHGMELSGLLAGGRRNPVLASFVLFSNAQSKTYSLAVRAIDQAKRGERAAAITSATGVVLSTLYMTVGVRMLMGALRGDKKQDPEESWTKELARRFSTETASLVPLVGQPVLVPIARRMWGISGGAYPGSAIDDLFERTVQAAGDGAAAVETAIEEKTNTLNDEDFWKQITRFVTGTIEVGSLVTGLPFAGGQDVIKVIDNFTADGPEELRDYFRQQQREEDVSEERKDLFDALADNSPEDFQAAVKALQARGEDVTPNEVRATINRRYSRLTKYEPGKPARNGVPLKMLMLIDQSLEERDALREIADGLIERSDVLDQGRRRRTGFVLPRTPRFPQFR